VVFVLLSTLCIGGYASIHVQDLSELDVEPLDSSNEVEELSLLQEEKDLSPLDKLSKELKNLHQVRSEADQMLSGAGKAMKDLNSAVAAKSAEGGTIAAGANGGDALMEASKAMDHSTDKCTDFYQYACGGWMNSTQRPADAASWTRTFSVINKRNMDDQRKMYESNSTEKYATVADDEVNTVKQWYSACMDESSREKKGLTDGPFVALMEQIKAVPDVRSMMVLYANFTLKGIDLGPFEMGVGADEMNSKRNVAGIGQAGLGLPSTEYYGLQKDNARFKQVREAYLKFIKQEFKMVGFSEDEADKVLSFESQLAGIMWNKVQMRDPRATYFPTTINNFTQTHLAFDGYFKRIRKDFPAFRNSSKFVVSPKAYFDKLETRLANTPIATLKAYTLHRFLGKIMPFTTPEAGEINFEFYGKALAGAKQRPALWKRCTASTTEALWGMADRMFVEKKFGGESKKLAVEMVTQIMEAFGRGLDSSHFMDPATVKAAKAKLSAIRPKIGYPSKWRTYTGLSVGNDFLQNILSSKKVELTRNFNKQDTDVDPDEWGMNPSMTNAYYSPSRNEIAFPAGILQPPFFSTEQPAVMNFGGIGSVIGHEITHGFDDQGAQFDAEGNMKVWWSNTSMAQFKNKTQCMVEQYNKIKLPELKDVAPNLAINGKLTLGENIADNGGLTTAYKAYMKWQKDKDTPTEYLMNGKTTTSTQLFFLSYGQLWCNVAAPKLIMVQIRSDPHTPSRGRVLGPLQNSKEFAEAMQCPSNAVMNPPKKCVVW
jgi:predicted metalloendopeptidase